MDANSTPRGHLVSVNKLARNCNVHHAGGPRVQDIQRGGPTSGPRSSRATALIRRHIAWATAALPRPGGSVPRAPCAGR